MNIDLNTSLFPDLLDSLNTSSIFLSGSRPMANGSPPGAPILTGSINKTTATLNWSPPLSSGSAPIQSYDIYQNGSLIGTTNSATTTYTISQLNPYNSYVFSVSAVNTSGFAGTVANVTLNATCFKEGTKILCWNEMLNIELYVPIEQLKKGMKVKTALNGFVPIEAIGKSVLYNFAKNKKNKDGLYKLSRASYPELFEDLYMTGAHSVLVDKLSQEQRDDIVELISKVYVTDNKYRLPVCLDNRSEPYNKEEPFDIWHLALQNDNYYMNYGIYANGLLVETSSIRWMKELFDGRLME